MVLHGDTAGQKLVRKLLSGNEAVAQGAWAAGVRVAAGYPGTPGTEILEHFAAMPGVYAEWSPNEQVALNVAIGAAYAGSRSMAVMKQVGLNVAADALFYAAATGLAAGLVLVVADDPGMHSSQDEQDSRRYARFARVPCLEPSDSQTARDLVQVALAVSEQFDVPVMLRTTTRIAHAHSVVTFDEAPRREPRTELPSYQIDIAKYALAPAHARIRRGVVEERMARLADFADTFAGNVIEPGEAELGIVANGVAYQYAREILPRASFLRLGMTYPLPRRLVARFAAQVRRLLVIEEQDSFIEEELRLLGIACEGKSIFPLIGELSPAAVLESAVRAGLLPPTSRPTRAATQRLAPPLRPPALCPGCPHRGIFVITNKLKLVVNGDIGCYGLGLMPPLSAVHTCGCMGASIGVAHGVAKAGVQERNVAVIGDSTFFHSGIPALLNVAYNKSNTITIIMDNGTTAMTGHQPHSGTGRTLQQVTTSATPLEPLVRALGIKHVYTVDPYALPEVEQALEECLALEEPAVIISQRGCALLPEARRRYLPLRVEAAQCVACGVCLRVGCPALFKSNELCELNQRPRVAIDPLLCTGCEICAQVCPVGAILFREQLAAAPQEELQR
jgi:indolepyruvate ferredoxin oxidoreductase alpha subunit